MLLVLFEQLRAAGVGVSMTEVLDAADALRHLDLLDRALMREALAASLVKRYQDRPLFDALFDRCFAFAAPAMVAAPVAPAAAGAGTPDPTPGRQALLDALRAGDGAAQRAVVLSVIDQCGIGTAEGSERALVYRVVRALDLAALLAAVMRAERAGAPGASALDLRLRREEGARHIAELRRLIESEVSRQRGPSAAGGPDEPLRSPADVDLFRATSG